jgi:hypothetical protein
MILIAIALFVIGFVLLVFAWRGRVVARGQFCRKCRFDLAGLDLNSPESKCPECGRGVQDESARRVFLRRPSRLGVGIAVVMILVSVGLVGFGISGKAGIILGALPDSTVFRLNDLGVDEALDELVVRVSKGPPTMSDALLSRAIEDALAYQADQSKAWDPRWGEVLSVMFGNPVMTDEQMAQYIANGIEIKAEIRDRVNQGDEGVSFTITTSTGRISALNFNSMGCYLFKKPIECGVVGGVPFTYPRNAGLANNLVVGNFGSSSSGWDGTIYPTAGEFEAKPGTVIEVYVEYELSYRPMNGKAHSAGRHRIEQSVLILAPDELVVPLFDDPALAEQVCKAISVSTVRVIQDLYDADPMRGHSVLAIRTQFEPMGVTTAFDVFLRFENGEEVNIGGMINHDPTLQHRGNIRTWPGGIFTNEVRVPTIPMVERLKAEGKVDILMRTNPGLADDIPGIERVLDVSLEFLDIPVEIVDKEFGLQKSASKPGEQFAGECP